MQGHIIIKQPNFGFDAPDVFEFVQGMCYWLCEQSSWMQVDISRTGIVSFMMVAEDVDADDSAD